MLKKPDWVAAEARIVEESKRAIENFYVKHPDEICSCFALSVDYLLGDLRICFDAIDNSLLHAKRNEARTVKAWDVVLCAERGWENALYYLRRDRLCIFNPHTADFKYPDFAKVHFSDWEDYFGNDQLPEQPDPIGYIIVLLHNVVGKLVGTGNFDRLLMSSPFSVGIEFPDDNLGLAVMRLLNWPSHQGPRV